MKELMQFKEFHEDMILTKELIVEMTNLYPNQSGIDGGVIYISFKNASHGCRIKFEPTDEPEKEFIVSIPKLEVVIDTTKKMKNKKKKQIILFAKLHSARLLKYWNEGADWKKESLDKFKKVLHLSDKQIDEIGNVKIVYKTTK
jgi:hypothetical protein